MLFTLTPKLKFSVLWINSTFFLKSNEYVIQKNITKTKYFSYINAAKNILAAGHVVLACGEGALAASMKQEPLNMGDLVSA